MLIEIQSIDQLFMKGDAMRSKSSFLCCTMLPLLLITSALVVNKSVYAQRGMQIDGGGKVEMLVIDPLGRKSGYDLIADREYDEIPGANVGASGLGTITDEGPEEDPAQPGVMAFINNPLDGNYQVVLYGFRLSKGYINIRAEHTEGPITNVVAGGIVDSASSVSFSFHYDYENRENTVLEKVVENTTLRQDLDLCYKIGYITNKGIYNSLSKKVENAEKQADKGKYNTAINHLNAFINEVNAQRGKHIDEYAADKILIYDAEALIKYYESQ